MKQTLSYLILRLFGWSLKKPFLNHKKYILIGAPHTSNWDFPIAILGLSALGINATWVAKDSLFKGPLKYIFNSLSGIPVNRKFCLSFLLKASHLLKNNDNIKIALMPEGTRAKKNHWKFGFYHLAFKENVPIALGYIDYRKKIIGIGEIFQPNNIEDDLSIIQNFYSNKEGKNQNNKSEIKIRHKDLNKIKSLIYTETKQQ